MATPFMNLTLPTPSVTIGPTWATNINTALTSIDSHNHTAGQGVQIPSAGININADLLWNNFNFTGLRSTKFTSQNGVLALTSDINCVYVNNGDLFYNNGSNQSVRL